MRRIQMVIGWFLLIALLAGALAAPVQAQQGNPPGRGQPEDPFHDAQREIASLGQSMWRLGVTVLLVISALLFLVAAGGTIAGVLTGSTRSIIWGLAAVFGAAAVLLVIGGVVGDIIRSAGGRLAQPPSFMP